MNYNIACNILNLKPHFTQSELRKNYHILALQYHPDKNKNKNAEDIFKQIVESYNYLNDYSNKNNNSNNEYSFTEKDITYSKLISDFINIITTNDSRLIKIFKDDCLDYSLAIINSLDYSILLLLSNYINIFYHLFNTSKETLEIIINTIKNRLQKTNVYILNPTLENIKNNEVYCLEHEGETIYIPLWHRELIYNDITIKCIPDLPENVQIDDDNNIHYKVFIEACKIFETSNIEIDFCGDKHSIPIEKLYIKHYQTFTLKDCGISQINTTNILDIDKKSHLIVHIFINS
tara:strand:- start:6673 stop:7545 length:873 start_codon:yes stop_codon:yes gene_type:complete